MKNNLEKTAAAANQAESMRLDLEKCQRELEECQKRIKQMEALSARENSERQQTEEKLNRLNIELAEQAGELKAVNQTLLVSEQRLRIAIETGRIGLFVWDSTQLTNPGDWSKQLKEIFGLPLDADVTHDMFLKCVHPDDREHIDQCVMNARKGESGGEYRTEYRTIRPDDGSEHWVTARGQAFFNSEGKAIRFIGTVMDITERKRAEQFLSRVNAELEERISQRLADLSRTNEALQNEIAERKQVEDKLRQSQAYWPRRLRGCTLPRHSRQQLPQRWCSSSAHCSSLSVYSRESTLPCWSAPSVVLFFKTCLPAAIRNWRFSTHWWSSPSCSWAAENIPSTRAFHQKLKRDQRIDMAKNSNQQTKTGSKLHYGADTSGCPVECLPDLIRKRAYQLFEERGRQPGHELDDWLQAERETNQHLRI